MGTMYTMQSVIQVVPLITTLQSKVFTPSASVTKKARIRLWWQRSQSESHLISFKYARVCLRNCLVTISSYMEIHPAFEQLAKTEHLTPIEERIKNLHESMNAVRDLQDQLRDQVGVQAVDACVSCELSIL